MKFLAVLLLVLIPSVVPAAITLDATTSYSSSSNSTSCGGDHAAAGSGVTLALVWIGIDADETISNVTYGGEAMTLVGTSGSLSLNSDQEMHLYYKAGPLQGTRNFTVTHSVDNHDICIAQTFTGTPTDASAIVQYAGYDNSGSPCTSAAVTLNLGDTDNFMASGVVWDSGDNTPADSFTNCTSSKDFSSGGAGATDASMQTCDSTGHTGNRTHTIVAPNTDDECAMVSVEIAEVGGAGPSDPILLDSTGTQHTQSSTISWTHSTTVDPQGVIVFCTIENTSSDVFTGATYDGDPLTQVTSAADADGEVGFTEVYFLGSGVSSTDNPTVACTCPTCGTGADKFGASFVLTASRDLQLAGTTGFCIVEGNVDDPSCNVTGITGEQSWAANSFFSGLNLLSSTTKGSSFSDGPEADLGTTTASTEYLTATSSGGSITCDYTTTSSDDVAMACIAVQRVDRRIFIVN